jgi:tRNA1(Val) A37 N6-methylase TrmN6
MGELFSVINSINGHLHWLEEEYKDSYAEKLMASLNTMNENINFDPFDLFAEDNLNIGQVIQNISNISEKNQNQRKNGVFYTPSDLAQYMLFNGIVSSLSNNSNKVYNVKEIKRMLSDCDNNVIYDFCINKRVLDPTCGTGEFTLMVLKVKINLLGKINKISDSNILKALNTIYANDINYTTILLAKYCVLIYLNQYLSKESLLKATNILKKNYSSVDFVINPQINVDNVDIIIGNPPYVEYRELTRKPISGFGNIYADVISNSIQLLNTNGTMIYVVPISFISTSRMKEIRRIVTNQFGNVKLLSFADRPDSLFKNVHQKLNIIIAKKNSKKSLYTSQYTYWYKNERGKLFNNISIINNDDEMDDFIPKYGDYQQKSIFKKVHIKNNDSLMSLLKSDSGEEIYLGSRVSFYVKAFLNDPGSNEYKRFKVKKYNSRVILSIVNSSLFWMYWTMISDGWHITNKELSNFFIPNLSNDEQKKLSKLADELLKRLEKTKKYIGTVQTDYEYKHKYALDIIDKIDDLLINVYGLTDDEGLVVKRFARKYREGGKNV